MTDHPPPSLSDAEVLSALLDDNPEARAAFRSSLAPELVAVSDACVMAYRAVDACNQHPSVDDRFAQVRLFLHASLNHLVTSTNLLVAGFPLVSGHLMRQFGESVAMSLLCLDPQSGVFELYGANLTSYPVHEAVRRVGSRKQWARTRRLVNAADDGWRPFVELDRLWNHFSHAGGFSQGFQFKFAAEGVLVLGAEFDPDKIDQFRAELTWRRSGFEAVASLALAILRLLRRQQD